TLKFLNCFYGQYYNIFKIWSKKGQKPTQLSLFAHFFIFNIERKPIKSRIGNWHGTCNIKDEQENRRAEHVKNN
uniref:hypothetical protein n=1 Tax=Bacillus cereus group sp. BfR-BA-01451 TaxID=2920354 RepID=UPI001F5A39BF